MSITLAALAADTSPPSRPERSLTVCLKPDIVAEVQRLSEELASITTTLATLRSQERREQDGPQRMGDGTRREEVEALEKRDGEIRDELEVLLAEMAKYEGELRLRANLTDGEWRRWCNANPPREEGTPARDRDDRIAYGYCDGDKLLDSLGDFVHQWNGEPLNAEAFTRLIEPRTSTGDKVEMAHAVVAMYENPTDFRERRTALQSNLKRLSGSASPAPSEAPTSDSTAGSLDSSTAATTETATAAP